MVLPSSVKPRNFGALLRYLLLSILFCGLNLNGEGFDAQKKEVQKNFPKSTKVNVEKHGVRQ
jgi:hypothetical protein